MIAHRPISNLKGLRYCKNNKLEKRQTQPLFSLIRMILSGNLMGRFCIFTKKKKKVNTQWTRSSPRTHAPFE